MLKQTATVADAFHWLNNSVPLTAEDVYGILKCLNCHSGYLSTIMADISKSATAVLYRLLGKSPATE